MESRQRTGGGNDFLCYSSNGLVICRTGFERGNNCTLDLLKYITMFSLVYIAIARHKETLTYEKDSLNHGLKPHNLIKASQ